MTLRNRQSHQVSLSCSTQTGTEQVHSDPDDGRSLAELDRGVARLPHVDILGRVQGMSPSETTVTAYPVHEIIQRELESNAHRAKQRADASRLHRRK